MRRFRWVAIVAVIAVLVAGTMAFAQGPGGRRGGGGPGGLGFAPGIELRGLDLSDTQRSQIREIMQRYQQQMQSEIMLVLTPEQQAKAKALQAEREARMKQRLEQ